MLCARTPKKLLSLVWPLPRSLATTKGISVDVFSSPYLDVSVQAVPLMHLWIQCMMHDLHRADFSIRKSADQCVLTTPRSLSQLTTSFIGSQCQGIHPALLFALPFALFSFDDLSSLELSCELCSIMFFWLLLFLPDFKNFFLMSKT